MDDRIGRDEVEQLERSSPTIDTVQRLQLAAIQAARKIGGAQEGKRLAEERGDAGDVRFYDERESSAGPTVVLAQRASAKHFASVERQRQGSQGGRPGIDEIIKGAVKEILRTEPTLTCKDVGKRLDQLDLERPRGLKDLVADIRGELGIQRRRPTMR